MKPVKSLAANPLLSLNLENKYFQGINHHRGFGLGGGIFLIGGCGDKASPTIWLCFPIFLLMSTLEGPLNRLNLT